MNHEHHIKELQKRIEEIKAEPISSWVGKMSKSLKVRKIESKIRSLQKKSHGK